jgi:hypothetical protein
MLTTANAAEPCCLSVLLFTSHTSMLCRSALSLAGFCALLRHLGRLTAGLSEALAVGATTRQVWVS